jgi:hypothetical protein
MSTDRVINSVSNRINDLYGDNRCYCGLLAAFERKESGGQCVYRCPKGICDPESCGFVLRLPIDDKNAILRQHHYRVGGVQAAVNPGTWRKVLNSNRLDEGRSNGETSADSLTGEVALLVDNCTKKQGFDKDSAEFCTLQESLKEDGDTVLQGGISKQTPKLNAPCKRVREPADDATSASESNNCKVYTKFCLRCDEKGHWAKECRLVAEEAAVLQPASEQQKEAVPFVGKNAEGKCFHCQQEGHWAKYCPAKRRKQDGCPSGMSFSGVCHHCGQPGHWARDCKVKQFQKQAGLLTRPQGLCYKCNKPGHWSKECPMHNKHDIVSPAPSSSLPFVVKQQSKKTLSQRGGGGFGDPIW